MPRSLLITGGTGFIAANFSLHWTRKFPYDKIIILDCLTYASNLNTISGLFNSGKVTFERAILMIKISPKFIREI